MYKNILTPIFFIFLSALFFAGCGDPKPAVVPADKGTSQASGQGDLAVSSNNTATADTAASAEKGPFSDRILKMARIPFRNARELVITHEPMMKFLAEKLGVEQVKLVSAPDYKGIVDLLKNKKADMAWMGTFNYIDARNQVGVEPLVRPKRFGKSTYGGLIITHQDSGIKTIQDLKGRSFAFVDKKSASGYLFPKAAIMDQGINPQTDFSRIQYLKQHDSVCMAVLYQKVDAGAVYDDARIKLKSQTEAQKLKVIKKIDNIPNEPIVVSSELPQELKEKIKSVFLSLNSDNQSGKTVLNMFNKVCADHIEGFEVAIDKDYDLVRRVAELLKDEVKAAE
jgi:phosphonate transport system substrate-binding protein